METEHNIRLTSAELSNLWSNYMSDSMAVCVLSYFLAKVSDTQIKSVVKLGLQLSIKHIEKIEAIYVKEKHPIPEAFNEKDVNTDVEVLFGDSFYLHYIKQMSRIGVGSYGLSFSLSARADIREYYEECLKDTIRLDNLVTNVLLNKGLYVRAPFLSLPSKIEYIEDKNFLGGYFGKHRPLLAIEVTHIYGNIQTNAMGKSLIMGFSQVAKSNSLREFFVKGRHLAQKHIEALSNLLHDSQLKVPMTWDDTVTNSTESPFSDKLMLFHISSIIAISMADYGTAIGVCLRRDLVASYGKLMAELGLYAEEAAKLMIAKRWMEQPPQADDRDALAGV